MISKSRIKELDVINNFISGLTSRTKAELILNRTTRSISRILMKIKQKGDEYLPRINKGRKPVNVSCHKSEKQVVTILMASLFNKGRTY